MRPGDRYKLVTADMWWTSFNGFNHWGYLKGYNAKESHLRLN